jgi:hypothetical protein
VRPRSPAYGRPANHGAIISGRSCGAALGPARITRAEVARPGGSPTHLGTIRLGHAARGGRAVELPANGDAA